MLARAGPAATMRIGTAAQSLARGLQHVAGAVFARVLLVLPAGRRAGVTRRLLSLVPERLKLSLVGRAIKTFPPGEALPILSGPLRGVQWIPESSLHTCIAGDYEPETQDVLLRHIPRGSTVYDVGANVGFLTLLAARIVGEQGRVVAFEPLRDAVQFLRRHLELNGLENVQVVEAAVSRSPGRAAFQHGGDIRRGRLAVDGTGAVEVKVVGLDDFCASGHAPAPDFLKIDVEGGELDVLLGAERILTKVRPLIALSTHGTDTHKTCCELLQRWGYDIEALPHTFVTQDFDYLGELFATPSESRRGDPAVEASP
jgi:FkbM family methyltransferase